MIIFICGLYILAGGILIVSAVVAIARIARNKNEG